MKRTRLEGKGCYLSHELARALQAGSGVGSAVGEVLLRLQLLRALHVVPAAHQGLPLLLRCLGCPPLYLCMRQVNEVNISHRRSSTPSAWHGEECMTVV